MSAEPTDDPTASAPSGQDTIVALAELAGRFVRDLAGPEGVEAASAIAAGIRTRLSGEYDVDDFGFDRQLGDQVFATALRPLYKHWFRVEVQGIEHIPATGGRNASARCWSHTLTQLRPRIAPESIAAVDAALRLLERPDFYDLAFGTAVCSGHRA